MDNVCFQPVEIPYYGGDFILVDHRLNSDQLDRGPLNYDAMELLKSCVLFPFGTMFDWISKEQTASVIVQAAFILE